MLTIQDLTTKDFFAYLNDCISGRIKAFSKLKVYGIDSDINVERFMNYFSSKYKYISENFTAAGVYKSKDKDLFKIWLKYKVNEEPERYFEFYIYTRDKLWFLFSTFGFGADEVINKIIKSYPGLNEAWIPPKNFEEIIINFLKQTKNWEITKIIVKKGTYHKISADEPLSRTIIYYGHDAYKQLEKLKSEYNVFPTLMSFKIKDKFSQINCSVSNNFSFNLSGGRFDIFLSLLSNIINFYNEYKKLFLEKRCTLNLVKIETDGIKLEGFEIKDKEAVEIILSNEITEELKKNLKTIFIKGYIELEERKEPTFYSGILKELGNPFLSASILDLKLGSFFDMSASENKIVLTPSKNTKSDSLMRFYQLIVEQIDKAAIFRNYGEVE